MNHLPKSWLKADPVFPQAQMKPRISNETVMLGVGRVPKTKALTVRFESTGLFASLGNRAERERDEAVALLREVVAEDDAGGWGEPLLTSDLRDSIDAFLAKHKEGEK